MTIMLSTALAALMTKICGLETSRRRVPTPRLFSTGKISQLKTICLSLEPWSRLKTNWSSSPCSHVSSRLVARLWTWAWCLASGKTSNRTRLCGRTSQTEWIASQTSSRKSERTTTSAASTKTRTTFSSKPPSTTKSCTTQATTQAFWCILSIRVQMPMWLSVAK